MIRKESVIAVFPLAEEIAARGLAVFAKPNSVISELDRVTNSVLINNGLLTDVNVTDNQTFAELIEASTFDYNNPTQHDILMDSLVTDLSGLINNHLKFAKNTVKPIVLEFANKYQTAMSMVVLSKPENQYNVIVFNLPDPLQDMVFSETVRKYKNISNLDMVKPAVNCPVAVINKEQMLEFILTGDTEVDKSIVAWYSTLSENEYYNHICDYISKNGLDTLSTLHIQPAKAINAALAVFLYVNAVYNKNTNYDDSVAISSTAKENIVVDYRNYTGGMICKLLALIESFEKTGTVILSTIHNAKEITVYGTTYRTWLKSGGKTEYLFSALNLNLDLRTIDKLNANLEKLDSEWKAYSLFWNSSLNNKKLNIAKEKISDVFKEMLSDMSEEEKAALDNNITTHNMFRRLDKFLDLLKTSDIENPYKLALDVISQCRFYYSSAGFILNEIEELAKSNKDIEVDQAALLATIHYIVDYISNQLILESKF